MLAMIRRKRCRPHSWAVLGVLVLMLACVVIVGQSLYAADTQEEFPWEMFYPAILKKRSSSSLIRHVACLTNNWQGESEPLFLAEVVDDTGTATPNATVWVIIPTSERVNLEYEPALKIYISDSESVPIITGDYTFHASVGGAETVPVTKHLTSSTILETISILTGCPDAQPGETLTVEWAPISGAQGYYVAFIDDDTDELIWSNVASIFNTLPQQTSATIPTGTTQAGKNYEFIIFGTNSTKLDTASAMSGSDLLFSPGKPFVMETVCLTTNTPTSKFILLQVFLDDCYDNDIEGAQVWAVYPSGQQVSFIHDINEWYKPNQSDNPNPDLDQNYGTYTFYVDYGGKQMNQSRVLVKKFLPVPQNVAVTPWPLIRGQAFTVTWDAVPGANEYRIDVDERDSGKIIYLSPNSKTPSHNAPADIWQHLTAGNRYKILTQSADDGDYEEATWSSFNPVEFTAP